MYTADYIALNTVLFTYFHHIRFSDGTPFDYEKWIPDEPNDAFGSEKCGQIFAYNGL